MTYLILYPLLSNIFIRCSLAVVGIIGLLPYVGLIDDAMLLLDTISFR